MSEKEKKEKPFNRNKFIIFWSCIAAAILVVVIVINCLSVLVFDSLFTRVFGSTEASTTGTSANVDLQYHKSSYKNADDLRAYQEQLCEDIAAEGIVMLKGKDYLPLDASKTTLSLFSHSSVDFVYGGTGSGTNSTENNVNLKQGLEQAGFTVNQKLWDFYATGKGSSNDYKRGEGAIMYGGSEDWSINECPLSVIQSEAGLTDTFAGTTAVYVLSRTGGEGRDLARGMNKYTEKAEDKAKHYLEPDSVELEIIDYLNTKFEDVILIVNTNNAMELGWTENYENIKAILNVPGTGLTGNNAIGDILSGKVTPSGNVVDTFVYDNFSSPAMQNMGDFAYVNAKKEGTGYYYVTYAEGIYVGYRYYETRYEDVVLGTTNVGDYDYSKTVTYPFGYGQSFVDFTYSNYKVTENGDNFTVTVDVKNNGDYDAKETVQVYVQKPYTAGGVEKASVELVGYDKIEVAKKGTATATVTVSKEYLKSYDSTLTRADNSKGGYVLDAGTYYITAAADAHAAVNNILEQKNKDNDSVVDESKMTARGDANCVFKYNVADRDVTTYEKENDTQVVNRFDHATNDGITYLSRSNWTGTWPKIYGNVSSTVSTYGERANGSGENASVGYQYTMQVDSDTLSKLKSTDSLNPTADSAYTEKATFKAGNGVEFIDLRGKAADDPLWETLLDNMSTSEYKKLIGQSGYLTPSIKSINKPKAVDLDGPAGLNAVVGHASVAMSYPCEVLIASTWNDEYAFAMGESVGEDGLQSDTEGWYAPAMNIHRTPFAGRNFEYYSEDSFLSGNMGAAAVKGAASKGMYSFIKHFALNDQENHRTENGLATWSNEQAIREIYLRPFEMCVKSGNQTIFYYEIIENEDGTQTYEKKESQVPYATAIMSSFNRIGTTWAGGDWNLLTAVCRNEWGFDGFILTDYDNGGYMDTAQMLRAGGDAKLSQYGSYNKIDTSAADSHYAREAAKHIFYCVVNSAAVNGYIHGVEEIPGFSYYVIILIVLDVLAAAGIAFIGVRMFLKLRKESQKVEA